MDGEGGEPQRPSFLFRGSILMQFEMDRLGRTLIRLCLLLLGGFLSGCAAPSLVTPVFDAAPLPPAALLAGAAPEPATRHGTALPSYPADPTTTATSQPCAPPFALETELSVEVLVEQVLVRNPSLAQMVAAWQAASARYPQVTSLEDPMFAATIGPGTIAPDDRGVEFAYRLEISQKLPFPGKLKLRGDNALAEASAAGRDVDDMRLQLVESARTVFYDYYLVDRALEVNEESLGLLRGFRQNAQTRYQTGLVPEQDVLQADVEIGREQDRRLELEQMRQVAVARMNTLLHLTPDSPLPPPPTQLQVTEQLPDAQVLRATALARRPDLQALADRIAAEEASLGLAHKEFYPDFEPFLMYDRFMGNLSENRDLATFLGVRLNLPVYKGRRYGAVAEAEARIAQRRAELARLTDQVNFQVQEAYARVQRSERSVRLYRDTILRAAEANVKAAQSAYVTGKTPFLSLIEAQRNAVGLRDRYYEALADYFRRRAALERAVGGRVVAPAADAGKTPAPK
jgi:cobalt-zinc-cadmium efflux system outer membrane protein